MQHDFTLKDTLTHTSKYFLTSLVLSYSYFTLNEHVYYKLQQNSIKNYFLSHSLTSVLMIPIFTLFQKSRGFSWQDSRIISYRYIGTLCCGSLLAEFIISVYRNSLLNNIDEIKLDHFQGMRRRESLKNKFESISGKKLPEN